MAQIIRAVSGSSGSYTDEQVRDVVAAMLVAGSNVTLTNNDTADTLTVAAATTGASGIPATIVDAKGDLVGASAADTAVRVPTGTVDGQTLIRDSTATAGVSWSNGGGPPIHTVGNAGSTLILDAAAAAGYIKKLTLNSATCAITLTGGVSGRAVTMEVWAVQDATGGRLIAWPTSVILKWRGGVTPTLSTTAGAIDRYLLTYDGVSAWFGDEIGKAYA